MNSFEKLQLKVILEKLIVGLEEPILIKSVGKMIAKIDSGNGGYNVIHGENLYYQGDVLTFETSDINGNRKVVSKKVKDTIKINIGGGNIQERPVIELNIKFAGEDYKKIPFSVTDRSTNDQKVLISKDFLVNQLDALIDPSTKDIADKNIDIDYPLNEATGEDGRYDISKNALVNANKVMNNFTKKWGEMANINTKHLEYKETFGNVKNLLKNVLPFYGNQVPILNQLGVPKEVKKEAYKFNSYVKIYDKAISELAHATDQFLKQNENFNEEKNDNFLLNEDTSTVPVPGSDPLKRGASPSGDATGTSSPQAPAKSKRRQ